MHYEVTEEQRNTCAQDGALALKNVVSAEWLEVLKAGIERDISEPGPFFHGYVPDSGVGKFHGNIRIWETDSEMERFCTQGPLVSLAAQFFQSSKINLFYDQLFVKEPGTENRTRWHNDLPYWPVRIGRCGTLRMLPITGCG